jgi:hypothetical protein
MARTKQTIRNTVSDQTLAARRNLSVGMRPRPETGDYSDLPGAKKTKVDAPVDTPVRPSFPKLTIDDEKLNNALHEKFTKMNDVSLRLLEGQILPNQRWYVKSSSWAKNHKEEWRETLDRPFTSEKSALLYCARIFYESCENYFKNEVGMGMPKHIERFDGNTMVQKSELELRNILRCWNIVSNRSIRVRYIRLHSTRLMLYRLWKSLNLLINEGLQVVLNCNV